LTVEAALETALSHRSDLKAEAARQSAAAELVRARKSERLPTVGATASWGAIGINPGTMNGNYDVGATLRIPILTGGQIKADIVEADATLERRTDEYEDLKARVAFDVRNAFLDVDAADDSVGVSQRNVELSHRGLKQAQDRFQVGLATNYEVIQAQEAVAASEENLIASINAHNLAKLELIRALGIAEPSLTEYVKTQKLPDRQTHP
jgi:outer membrane protein TolC